MPLERRDVEAGLVKKGFAMNARDHRHFIYHTIEEHKTSVWTKTSEGTGYKTLSDSLVSQMAKQCGLTSKQFRELVECPLARDKLDAILLDTGRIMVSK